MLLSIIVPAYNSEKTIEKCLHSIINQSFDDYELIVINDGSNDSTLSVVERIIEENKSKNIRVITQENKGLPQSRKVGVNNAKGTYIGFVDSDDWIEADMYQNLIQYALRVDADMSYCKMSFDYSNAIDVQRQLIDDGTVLSGKEALHVLHNRIGIEGSFCNKIIKKSMFCGVKFPIGGILQEDYIVVEQILLKVARVICVDKLGYHYVQYNGSMALSGYGEVMERGYHNYKRMLREVRYSGDKQLVLDMDNYMVNNFMWIVLGMDKNKNYDWEKIKWVKSYIRKRIFSIVMNKNNTLLCKGTCLVMCFSYSVVANVYRLYRKKMYIWNSLS